MTNSSGKEREETDLTHGNCSRYNLKCQLAENSRDGDVSSIGFHRIIEARERELTDKEKQPKFITMLEFIQKIFQFCRASRLLYLRFGF